MSESWCVSDCYWSISGVNTVFYSGMRVEELRKCVKSADDALERKHFE